MAAGVEGTPEEETPPPAASPAPTPRPPAARPTAAPAQRLDPLSMEATMLAIEEELRQEDEERRKQKATSNTLFAPID